MRSTIFVTLGAVLLPFVSWGPLARAAEETNEFPVKVVERVLSNGLKVLVIPRKGAPAVSCAIAYRVGSLNERSGQTGMAHYLEHMMFKGTEKMGVKDRALDAKLRASLDAVIAEKIRLEDGPRTEEVERRLEALKAERSRLIDEQKQNLELNPLFTIYREGGATFTNAMTSQDWTTYICALPLEKVELFFWVESERLQHCIFRQFHAEKDVVREERRMHENRPGAAFNEGVQRALFGAHPYAHSVLGSHEDLRALTRDELRAFFDAYYAPDNAVLFVGGDVDPERIFALAERYFGAIQPSTAKRARVPVLTVPRSGEIRMEGRGEGRSSVDVYFRVPAAGTGDALALDLLAMHLGDDEGDLFKDLVEKDKVAVSARANYDGRKAGGVLQVSATLSPTGTHEAVEARVWQAIQALRDAPLSDDAMADLRRRYRAGVLGTVRSDMMLGFTILRREMSGSWHDIERDLVRVKTLPAEAIQTLARTYLVPENVLVAEYTKDEAPKTAGDVADTGPAPAPVPPRLAAAKPAPLAASAAPSPPLPASWKDLVFSEAPFELPSGAEARHVLSNGICAFVVANVGDPVVRVAAEVLGGSAEDPEGKEGLSQIAAGVLGEAGIPGLDAAALKEHLEGLVASLSTGSDVASHTVSISVFPADLDEGLRILDLLLREPVLDETAFERIKEGMLSRIDAEDTRMRVVTGRLYRRLLWGDVPETRRPTRASVEAITFDDVRAKLAAATGPRRILLAASGDFDMAKMTARLDGAFGGWNPEGIHAYERPTIHNDPAVAAHGLHVRDMPASSQGSVRIGQVTVQATHEDAPALRVLAAVLARRAFDTIRSVHGLAYQASARFAPSWRNDSPFTLLFQSKCESVPFAIELALVEIRKLIQDGPTDAEVEDAKGTLDARFRGILGQGSRAASAFATLEVEGAALDHYDRLRKAYAAVDAAAVQAVAARHLDPEKMVVLCVGDVAKIAPGDGEHPATLTDFGEMTRHQANRSVEVATPAAVVRQILAALEAGDVEALKGHATAALRARLDAMEDASARLGMLQTMLQSATVSAPEVTTTGDQAEARVGITATMGEETMNLGMRLGLVKEEGAWKCDTFQVGP